MAQRIPVNPNRANQQPAGYIQRNEGFYPLYQPAERDRVPPHPLTRRQWILVILLTLLLLDKHFLSFLGSIENGNFSLLPTVTNTEQHRSYSANNNLPAPLLENNNQEVQPVKEKEYSWILIRSWPAARVVIENKSFFSPAAEPIMVTVGQHSIRFVPFDNSLQTVVITYAFEPNFTYELDYNLEANNYQIRKVSEEGG